jgi:hypothetical protein
MLRAAKASYTECKVSWLRPISSLNTKSLDTLTFKEEGKSDINYLVNKHILPIEVSNVRIFTCD